MPDWPAIPLIPKPIGFLDIIGHSHMAETGASMPDFGSSHKIDGFLQPATLRMLAMGGSFCSSHNQGNGAFGDGGWATAATEWDRQEMVTGRGYSTLTGGPTSIGATSITVAANNGFTPSNYYVFGKGSTTEVARVTAVVGTTLTIAAPGLANAHATGDPVYFSVVNMGYLAKSELVLCGYGINDLALLGPFAQGVFGTNAGASRGLVPLQHALRFCLALARCCVVYQNTHPNIVYGANWTANPVTSTASYPAQFFFGGNAGNYQTTTTVGANLSFSTESNFPGGTVDLFFITDPFGNGALWNVGVAGATTQTLNSAIDTRSINLVDMNDGAGLTTAKVTASVYRIKNLNPGVNTITLTVAATNGTAFFMGWGIEAPQPPMIFCELDPRPPTFLAYASNWPYMTRSPVDTNFNSTQTATVSAGAGTGAGSVTLGTAVTLASAGTAGTPNAMPGDTITIGSGSAQETRRIVGFDSTTTLHVDANFVSAHSGHACVIGLQDADLTGGGYVNTADTQGAVSVPGMWSAITSVVGEFDGFVQTVNIDPVVNPPGRGSAAKTLANYVGDLLHYSDQGHALIASAVLQQILQSPWSNAQIALPTVPNKRTWIPVFGDVGATPAAGPGTTSFQNSWTNYFPTNSSYPRTGFYKDMRTRQVYVRLAVTGGSPGTTIFTLPAGYLPQQSTAVEGFTLNEDGSSDPARLVVLASGAVQPVGTWPGVTGAIVAYGSWLAEA